MIKRFAARAVAGALVIYPCVAPAPARAGVVSFVSGKGVDAGTCSAITSPCKTLAFALSKTSAGGEIKALDAADYGPATITQSVTIFGVEGASVFLNAAGDGIVVNAGSTGVVNLIGLSFDGFGAGTRGVLLNSAATIKIKNCIFRRWGQNAIKLAPTSAAKAYLENITIVRGGNVAVLFEPVAPATIDSAVSRFSSIDSLVALQARAGSKVTVEDSVANHNTVNGFIVDSGAQLRLARTTAVGNINGVSVTAGGAAESAGDNFIRGNTTNISGTLTNVGTQ